MATQILSQIKSDFQVAMPLRRLFEAPTVADLAKIVEQLMLEAAASRLPSPGEPAIQRVAREAIVMEELEQDSSEPASPSASLPQSSILVNIQPAGVDAPFFCVHPVGGQVLCYVDLAGQLGSQRPFYGLQSPPAHTLQEPAESIEQVAALYIREIRSVQPRGPYWLGGWSMGGLVAFEMARQLRQAGETLDLLALFDTHPPRKKPLGGHGKLLGNENRNGESGSEMREPPMLVRFAMDMGRLLGKDISGLAESFLQLGPEEQRKLVVGNLVSEGIVSPDAAHAEMEDLLEIFTRNAAAMDRYVPPPLEQSIVLFAAADAEESRRLAREWAWWAGGVDLQSVPGDHYTMLRRPHVSVLAGLLKGCLDEVRRDDGPKAEYVGVKV